MLSDSGSMLSLDAQRGMGQSMAFEAMNLAIERARQHGVCVMGLRHAHHIGRIGHWAEQAVSAGLISVHFVNALSKPVVAPFRGIEARYVTNPFTVGIPVPGREPVLLDYATSAIAMGKVRVAFNSGKKVPGDMLMDLQGDYTDDPGALFPADGGPGGALVPFAQHKGYALAMVCEMLGAALTGGDTTRPAHLTAKYGIWNNMLALVFDPARLSDQQLFGAEVNAFVDWVQSARLRDDDEPILVPGDPERASRRARAERAADGCRHAGRDGRGRRRGVPLQRQGAAGAVHAAAVAGHASRRRPRAHVEAWVRRAVEALASCASRFDAQAHDDKRAALRRLSKARLRADAAAALPRSAAVPARTPQRCRDAGGGGSANWPAWAHGCAISAAGTPSRCRTRACPSSTR